MNTENIFYVYVWKRPDTNEVFYVGKGSNNRIDSLKSRNNHVLNVVKKYGGLKSIIKEKIYENLSEAEAFKLEKETISNLRITLKEKLLNISDGGDGSSGWFNSLTDEEKNHHREISKSWSGKKHTDEQKRKISESKKGKKHTDETNKKVSETRKKKFQEGKLLPFWKGKNLSEETKRKISETRKEKFKNNEYGDIYKKRKINHTPEHMKYLSNLALEKRAIIKYYVFNEKLDILSIETLQSEIENKYSLNARTARTYMKKYKEEGILLFHKNLKISVLPEELFKKLISQSTIESISDQSEKKQVE